MQYNTRRAILRRVKKGWDMKLAFESMMKDKRYWTISYADFLKVRTEYLKKKVHDWYKWCNVCWCEHPYTYEVFWYNWYNSDWSRRLHSVCLKARLQIKKNIIIMKDKRYEWMRAANKRSRLKNKWNWKKISINDMTPEEQKIQRESRRKSSAKRYLKKKNGKKENK